MAEPALAVADLQVRYGSKKVLDNLSFKLDRPGFLGVLGRNGSGKSSLLKALNRDISYSGSISYLGRPLNTIDISELSGLVSYLPQKLNLGINMTVKELVGFGRIRYRHFFSKERPEDREKIDLAIKRCGLRGFEDKYLDKISGGERQLAWLAQIIAQDAPIIILDEPTLNLDLHNRKFVFDTIRRFYEEEDKAIILVTHEVEYLRGFSGKGIFLSDNEVVQDDLTEEFISSCREKMEQKSTA